MKSEIITNDSLSFIENYRVVEQILAQIHSSSGHQVITILSRATETELSALASLFNGHELQRLIQLFLAQDDNTFQLVDRKAIIQFLRRPDLPLMVLDLLADLKARYLVLMPIQNEYLLSQEDKVHFPAWVAECRSGDLSSQQLVELERKIMWVFQEVDDGLDPKSFVDLAQTYPDNRFFSLMGRLRHGDNLKAAIDAIFNSNLLREALFKGLFEEDFHRFLVRNHAASGFAEYLIGHFEQPWFDKGLKLFAAFSQVQHYEHLLSDALMVLARNIQHGENYPKLLSKLLGVTSNAEVLLHDFFQDKGQGPVQGHQHLETAKISACFDPAQLVDLAETVVTIADWEHSAQYKIVLHLLHQNFIGFFNAKDLVARIESPGQELHLQKWIAFLNAHLSKSSVYDKNMQIGQSLFAELLFRCAHLGSTAVFYSEGALNRNLLGWSMSRPFLMELIDRYWVPEAIRGQFIDDKVRAKAVFEGQQLKPVELNQNPLLVSWHQFMHNYKKLPVICVYLMYYAGKKQDAAQLLNDYFEAFAGKEECLCSVTPLLRVFPHRKISALIFEVLHEHILNNPSNIKGRALDDMAVFYKQAQQDRKPEFSYAILGLIQLFGQQKQYNLVQKCCDVLQNQVSDKRIKGLLQKAAKEARVESRLEDFKSNRYFSVIISLYRLWYYGPSGIRNTSNLVTGCDSEPQPHELIQAPEWISRPESVGCHDKTKDFMGRKSQFIKLLSTISKCSVRGGQEVSTPLFTYELFSKAQSKNSSHVPKDVTAETNMVN